MINLSLDDHLQIEIKRHIETTERLLARAASLVSGSEQESKIWLMPDLGIPRGVSRIHGGFFTGAFYSWESSVPIVPVDATVNCCSVSLFKVNIEIETEDNFLEMIREAILRTEETTYLWNLETSNHFIAYGEIKGAGANKIEDGRYIIIHSSALEFKKQHNGLYPVKGNWYWNDIRTISDSSTNRYLRFIHGKKAERFFKIAKMLEEFNRLRHQYFAGLIVGEKNIEDETLCLHHYGMPTQDSLAIGCLWLFRSGVYLLLTDSISASFLIETNVGGMNQIKINGDECLLQPHGLGTTTVRKINMEYLPESLRVNNRVYKLGERLPYDSMIKVRDCFSGDESTESPPLVIKNILDKCPGEIIGYFEPIYTYNRLNIHPETNIKTNERMISLYPS